MLLPTTPGSRSESSFGCTGMAAMEVAKGAALWPGCAAAAPPPTCAYGAGSPVATGGAMGAIGPTLAGGTPKPATGTPGSTEPGEGMPGNGDGGAIDVGIDIGMPCISGA